MDNFTVVTTSKPRNYLIDLAKEISKEINIPYIPRENLTNSKLKKIYGIKTLIVVREDKIEIADEDFFFHPGMAKVRIKTIQRGNEDIMIKAMALKPGDSLLDCTLGLGNDAIVASYIIGNNGKIIGLESNPIIYIITKMGLKLYNNGKVLKQAMRNIKVLWTNYKDYLKTLEDNCFDIVYFDPMFEKPVYNSSGIKGLRKYANYEKLEYEIIKEALRVARKRVVFKDRSFSSRFKDLKVNDILGGKSSSISYGIYYK